MKLAFFTTVIVLLVATSSCQKEEVAPVKPTFAFTYKVFNQGSEAITRINLYTTTVYPEENISYLTINGNSIFYEDYEENHLFPYDSITEQSDPLVYPGCVVSMEVAVAHFVMNDGYQQERFVFYAKQDTIRSVADSVMSIAWPRDSVLFERVQQ